MKKSEIARLTDLIVSSTDDPVLQLSHEWKYVTSVRKKTDSGRVPTHTFISRFGWRADITNNIVSFRKDHTIIVRREEVLPTIQKTNNRVLDID